MNELLQGQLLLRLLPSSDPPQQNLFHYSSLKGFKGIIKDQKIWATDISYLNDSREYTCAVDAIAERMKERSKEDRVLEFLAERLPLFNWRPPTTGPYVVSFSKCDDSLSQWRAYCGGGAGVSLGFDPAFLLQTALNIGRETPESSRSIYASLVKCIYHSNEKNELIDKLIKFLLEYHNDGEANTMADRIDAVFGGIALIAPSFKDEAFESEDEWRIVIIRSKPDDATFPLEYRDGNSMLLPYINLPLTLSSSALTKVLIGPTPHPALSKQSVEDFLRCHWPDYPPDRVVNSKVPFRNW